MEAVATTGVVVWAGEARPYQFNLHEPACGTVPNGSVEVFDMATPVSNPARFVKYGNSRTVWQAAMENAFAALEVSRKRGIGSMRWH